MFLMFELMAITFVLLFCITTQARRDMEQLEQDYHDRLVIERLERDIHEAEQQLKYIDELQKSLKTIKE